MPQQAKRRENDRSSRDEALAESARRGLVAKRRSGKATKRGVGRPALVRALAAAVEAERLAGGWPLVPVITGPSDQFQYGARGW